MLVVVEHEGDASWAAYVADQVAAYLPAAEQYLGVPLHQAAGELFHAQSQPWTVRIVGRARVMLGDTHIGAYNNTSGLFGPDRGIFLEYALAPMGNPALVLHEVSHFWFRGPARGELLVGRREDDVPAWFVEGLASMTPVVVAEAGMFRQRRPASDRKSTRLNSSHHTTSRMPSSA